MVYIGRPADCPSNNLIQAKSYDWTDIYRPAQPQIPDFFLYLFVSVYFVVKNHLPTLVLSKMFLEMFVKISSNKINSQ